MQKRREVMRELLHWLLRLLMKPVFNIHEAGSNRKGHIEEVELGVSIQGQRT